MLSEVLTEVAPCPAEFEAQDRSSYPPAQPGPSEATLPALLRQFRLRRQLSMQGASALLPVARTVWRTWELGVIPSPPNLARLVELLALPPDAIRAAAGPDLVRRAHGCPCGLPHGLAALRVDAGLTSRALAALVHVSPSTITHWEAGERTCGWHDRERLAGALSVARATVDTALGPLPRTASVPYPGLSRRRAAAGVKQSDLAKLLGVDAATVRRWEKSDAAPVGAVPILDEVLGSGTMHLVPLPVAASVRQHGPLARMRIQRNYPVAVVAGRLGVSRSAVHSWERGTRNPSWADLRRLARMYRQPVAAVFQAAGREAPRSLRPPPWTDAELPAVLVELRQWAGLTQAGLARELGVGAGSVASWERGRNVPSARAKKALLRWVSN